MRSVLTFLAIVATLLGAASAHAEKRTFIITATQKADPVHGCLKSKEGCGTSVANALCRDRGFTQAANHRKLDQDEVTGAVPTSGSTVGVEFFTIECTR